MSNYNDWLSSFTSVQRETFIERVESGKVFHGVSRTKEYRTLMAMKTRCYNKNFKRYADYGGRGITICDRWLDKRYGYENFIADMGRCPEGLTSIDRIDNNGAYCKENCRWSDQHTQNENRRTKQQVAFDREKFKLTQLKQSIE